MRRALLALALVAGLVIAGCGGGSETAKETQGGAGGGAGAGSAQGTTGGGGTPPPAPITSTATQDSDEVTQIVQFKPDSRTPAAFKKLLRAKKPIVVLFYLVADPKTADENREIAPLKKRYGKSVIFVSYDINDTGSSVISEQLKAGYSPYFLILDKRNYIVYRYSGFIDRLTLEQRIFSTLRR